MRVCNQMTMFWGQFLGSPRMRHATMLMLLCWSAACAPPVAPSKAPLASGLASTTLSSTVPPEVSPSATAAPADAAVLTPYVPFAAATNVDNVVLRAGPGYLFDAKTTLPQGARVVVLGRAAGGEWIFVTTEFERIGWIFGQLLSPERELVSAPLLQPADLQVLRGQVQDEQGRPISGIQFAIVQGSSGSPPRNDAVTDATGTFYAYMPLTATGTWSVSFTAVACTSNTMDESCQCLGGACGKPDPEITGVSLPYEEVLMFIWN